MNIDEASTILNELIDDGTLLDDEIAAIHLYLVAHCAAQVRIGELEAENERLRNALEDIRSFSSSPVIEKIADEGLKGEG